MLWGRPGKIRSPLHTRTRMLTMIRALAPSGIYFSFLSSMVFVESKEFVSFLLREPLALWSNRGQVCVPCDLQAAASQRDLRSRPSPLPHPLSISPRASLFSHSHTLRSPSLQLVPCLGIYCSAAWLEHSLLSFQLNYDPREDIAQASPPFITFSEDRNLDFGPHLFTSGPLDSL